MVTNQGLMNLLRDTETGETMQLSHDGEQGYEYATPLLGEGLLLRRGLRAALATAWWLPQRFYLHPPCCALRK